MSLPASLKASFTAGTPASVGQDLNRIGTTVFYFGTTGAFSSATLQNPGGTGYSLTVINSGGVSPYPTPAFALPKSDSDPSNPVGTYSDTIGGTTITAQLLPA